MLVRNVSVENPMESLKDSQQLISDIKRKLNNIGDIDFKPREPTPPPPPRIQEITIQRQPTTKSDLHAKKDLIRADNSSSRLSIHKPPKLGSKGQYMLYTEMRASNRERPCCSNSHSPDHKHHSPKSISPKKKEDKNVKHFKPFKV